MRISIASQCNMQSRGVSGIKSDICALTQLHDAGFDTFDLDLVFVKEDSFILRQDDWMQRIEKLGQALQDMGATVGQCHMPWCQNWTQSGKAPEYIELFDKCMERAYYAAAMLKAPVGVQHPRAYPEFNHETKACFEANRAYFDRYVELGIKLGVDTAFENMIPFAKMKTAPRYCRSYEDLIALVDSYADSHVGICWDTGHANLNYMDQYRAIKAVGYRLKALHINDNHKEYGDEHILPYDGEISWEQVLDALIDVGYCGTLNYEIKGGYPEGEFQRIFMERAFANASAMLHEYNKRATKTAGPQIM